MTNYNTELANKKELEISEKQFFDRAKELLDNGGIVDTTGGTLVCKGDPVLNWITKYIAQTPCSDFKAMTTSRIDNGLPVITKRALSR